MLANIALVGEKPLTEIHSQGVHIVMPKDQSKPFYLKEASFVIRSFPHLYKPVVPKGDK